MKPPTIADAKKLALELLTSRGVIILAFDGETFCGASYGHTRKKCDGLGKLLQEIFHQLNTGELQP